MNTLYDGENLEFLQKYTRDETIDLLAPMTSAVPEPGSITRLVGLVSVGAGILRRKRRAVTCK